MKTRPSNTISYLRNDNNNNVANKTYCKNTNVHMCYIFKYIRTAVVLSIEL